MLSIQHRLSNLYKSHPHYFTIPRLSPTCHNLCTTLPPPPEFKCLLSLGLKFCLRPNRPTSPHILNKSLDRFRTDILTKVIFADKEETADWKPNQLFIRSNWDPRYHLEGNNAEREIIARLNYFDKSMRQVFGRSRKTHDNLLPLQRAMLLVLRNSTTHVVVPTDKNLGPAIIERAIYTQRALDEHLNNNHTYERLSHDDAINQLNDLKAEILSFIQDFKESITKPDQIYLKRSLEVRDPLAHFYLTPKVHKTPWTTRPIVSVCGSLLHGLGRWLDQQLQPIVRKLPSYLESSFALKAELKDIQIPENAALFTMDAVSMYTNIDTDHALYTISDFLKSNPICSDINEPLITRAMEIIMRNNIFQFDDTYWKQLSGTAMGTPPACSYAAIYYAVHEYSLLDQFATKLYFYRRYIDDGFGIWLHNEDPVIDAQSWQEFQEATSYGNLRWEFSSLTNRADYLDLSLKIHNNKIVTSLYEKPMNLHLYLPAHSAHPPGVLKSLVQSMIWRIVTLTSCENEKKKQINQFFTRLLDRGYRAQTLAPIFQNAYKRACSKDTHAIKLTDHSSSVFFHIRYNPADPPARTIQHLFQECVFQPHSGRKRETPLPLIQKEVITYNYPSITAKITTYELRLNRLVIAYHRQRNLRELLFPRRFRAHPRSRASRFTTTYILGDSEDVNNEDMTNLVHQRRRINYREKLVAAQEKRQKLLDRNSTAAETSCTNHTILGNPDKNTDS